MKASIAVLAALTIYSLPLGFSWEENFGLDLLFKLRGVRPAPDELTLVAIDKESAERLGIANDPARWPRRLHAQVVTNLARAGAVVVVMDIYFKERKDAQEDQALIQAVQQANNVVLFAHLRRETVNLGNRNPQIEAPGNINELLQPFPELAQVASAIAPFALPKVPVRINQFWTFHTTAGDIPTLPVAALEQYAFKSLKNMQQGPNVLCAHIISTMLAHADKKQWDGSDKFNLFSSRADIASLMLQILTKPDCSSLPSAHRQLLRALIETYNAPHRPYLNFYGPPKTLNSVSYVDLLNAEPHTLSSLRDKVVFIGFAEQKQAEQRDNFYTVFSQDDGLDLSGVEIAATAFGNLLEGSTLKVLPPFLFILIIVLYAMITASLGRLRNITMVIGSSLLVALGYFYFSFYLFITAYYWFPLAVPILVETPLILFLSLWSRHHESNQKRLHMHHAFSHYLPKKIVNQIENNKVDPRVSGQLLHSVCLATDAQNYTQLAEGLSPEELAALINRYYAVLFSPVRVNHGTISDVVGDAMLAIWPSLQSNSTVRIQACRAAVDIVDAVAHFNSKEGVSLRTRIGLHCGQVVIGSIGAEDHLEYRAVGDVVNTANRIQNFNKQLNTTILCSEEVALNLVDFFFRKVGVFQFAGKSRPIVLYELLGTAQQFDESLRVPYFYFEQALNMFFQGKWETAKYAFKQVIKLMPEDGPSIFFLQLCRQYMQDPPLNWQCIMEIKEK